MERSAGSGLQSRMQSLLNTSPGFRVAARARGAPLHPRYKRSSMDINVIYANDVIYAPPQAKSGCGSDTNPDARVCGTAAPGFGGRRASARHAPPFGLQEVINGDKRHLCERCHLCAATSKSGMRGQTPISIQEFAERPLPDFGSPREHAATLHPGYKPSSMSPMRARSSMRRRCEEAHTT
jgi:hypothetical protein